MWSFFFFSLLPSGPDTLPHVPFHRMIVGGGESKEEPADVGKSSLHLANYYAVFFLFLLL